MKWTWWVLLWVCIWESSTSAQTLLFQDDFSDRDLNGWMALGEAYSEKGELLNESEGWKVVADDGNFVLEGIGHNWIVPSPDTNFSVEFQARFKLIEGGFHFNILLRSGRYFFPVHPTFIGFINESEIAEINLDVGIGIWHTVRATLEGNHMEFFLDDTLLFEYDDPDRLQLWGKLGFENIDHVYIDDVSIIEAERETSPISAKWVRTGGPWGGIGYDVRIDYNDPDLIYVTDQWAGNHKTTDGGETWYPNNRGIESIFGSTGESVPIFCLTIDPNNSKNIWCGTFNTRGVYRSTDMGENWEKKINGIPDFPCGVTFRGFGIRPGDSNVVFSGLEVNACPDELPEGQSKASRGKIFKTEDGGENWREVLDSDALVRHILFNPQAPDTMYASTGIFDRDCIKEEGVWKSIDGGENWFHANIGLTDSTVAGLFMDPRDPETLWACTGREPGFGGDYIGGIFKTSNGGELWTKVFPQGDQVVPPIHSITTSIPNSDIIYASSEVGFYTSTNNGVSWVKTDYNIPGVYTGIPVGIAAHPSDENTVYINSYSGGVFSSNDRGVTWSSQNKGYTGAEMREIIVDPVDPLQVMAIGRSGIAKTDDGGTTWSGAGQHVLFGPMGEYNFLERNSQSRSSFLCGASHTTAIFKTTDKLEWDMLHDFREDGVEEGHGLDDVQYAHNDSNIIYAGLRYGSLPFIIDRPEQPYDPNIYSYGMFKSLDAGLTWNAISDGLEGTSKNVRRIAVHPLDPDIVYIGMYRSGIYKTTDGGANWVNRSAGLSAYNIYYLEIDPNNPETVYAGAVGGGLYKTTDGGVSWKAINYGMDPEATITGIAVDPTDSRTVFCSDWFSGVHHSNSGGEKWFPLNEGLTNRSVREIALSRDGEILYAATQGQGIFRLNLGENLSPQISSFSPANTDTIVLGQRQTRDFSVEAFDFDDDEIGYAWELDGSEIAGEASSGFTFDTAGMEKGTFELTAIVSDSLASVRNSWIIRYVVLAGDFDNSGSVDFGDFFLFADAFGGTNPQYDLDGNGAVDFGDFFIFADQFGKEERGKLMVLAQRYFRLPAEPFLGQNYPNPFNSYTAIPYQLSEGGSVRLDIFDLAGQRIRTLINSRKKPGYYEAMWDGSNDQGASVSTGIYLTKIHANGFTKVRKMLMIK